jgi:hypothetical protein
MAIPEFTNEGLLPPSIHDTTVDEVVARFGRTLWVKENSRQRLSLQRQRLTEGLQTYLAELQQGSFAIAVIINGSYVTNKPEPNDVDLFVVYPANYDRDRPLTLAEQRLLDNRRTMQEFGINVFDGPEGSLRYERIISKWSEVRGEPGKVKGMVRIRL